MQQGTKTGARFGGPLSLGLAGLVVLAGSRWVAASYWPSGLAPLAEQAVHELVIAVVAGLVGWRSRAGVRGGWLRMAGWAVVVLALPSVAVVFSGMSGLAVFTLVPAVVAFLTARGLLLGALVAVGGAMLLIPIAVPGSMVGWVWLVGMVLVCVGVGFGWVELRRGLAGVGVAAGVAVVFGASGLVVAGFAGSGLVAGWSWWGVVREMVFCGVVDGPVAVLLVWLVREMVPVRLASRYVLIPLVSISEGYLVMGVLPGWMEVLGMVLMVVGAGYLLVGYGEDTTTELGLR